jgi:anthranilate phosphoribosyltransferase
LAEGVVRAGEAISSGEAANKLKQLVAKTAN